MELTKKTYRAVHALILPFKAAPFFVCLQFFLAVLQAVVSTAMVALSTAYFVDTAIAVLEGERDRGDIYPPFIIILIVVGFNTILSNLPALVVAKVKLGLERKLMPAFIDVRASLSFNHIESRESWELISRAADKPIEDMQRGLRSYLIMLRSIITIVSVLGLIVAQVWWAVPIIAAFSVPLLWLALRAGKKIYEAGVESRKYDRRYEYYRDVLTGREAVEERTLFGYGESLVGRYSKAYEKARKIGLKVSIKQWIVIKTASISMSLIAVLIALTLINPVISGDLSPGMFMGIVAAVFGMINNLGWNLQEAVREISKSREYMKDLTAFVELSRTEGAKDLPDSTTQDFESLEFRNVCFKYPTGSDYILKNLTFKLEGGKHYAFVGTNGAGKTTVTKLLTGLYADYEGEILINGKELRQYSAGAVKAMFSVVYQDFARYQISMSDNIALGNAAHKIPNAKIIETANRAGLKESIDGLSGGIDTPMGKIMEGGVDISGGEWQKVAISRSLLSPAPIKILDEPTAALDPTAESRIYSEFEKLMKGKTTIFISHRLGSTKLADEIMVIDGGCIAESGSHAKLMEQGGSYAEMFEAQRSWYE